MKNRFFSAALIVLLLIGPACSNEDLLDLNVNPNASNEIDLRFLLASGMMEMAGTRYESWRANLIYSSTMIQHNASLAGYWVGDKYLYNAGYSASQWERYYPNVLESITHVMDKTADVPESANLNAMATIARCFALHRLTDLYGAIPYGEAGRGLEGQEFWFPAYETQEQVYTSLIADLKAARGALSAGGDDVGIQDVLFEGDVVKWQRFANSLLVRIGMRMSGVDNATARSTVEEAVAHSAGVFTSNADNAMIVHSDAGGINRNGNSEVFRAGNGGENNNARPSETFIDWMQNGNDPRLMIISGGTGDSQDPTTWDTDPANQIGLPNGYDNNTILPKAVADGVVANEADFNVNLYSFLNPLLYDYDDPTFFITHAEVSLALAEATLNGWNVGGSSAEELFEAGVRSAISNWESYDASLAVSSTDVDTYIAGLGFGGASAADQERMIGEQYWAATYFNHYESYANWRRTGFPALVPTNYSGNLTSGQIPRRLRYPEGEISGNPESYAAAIAAQGPDEYMTKLWWDVN
ncbi:SusD/RagB family nutrient-binding outer membrane lipoprotein [Fulvivirgaceae bacterium BMA10]|uniref:SusD/RagB family nutrient-binding outer membrane lipoprotein n=1 Tax=Splendidivirga corallicola TaxID=3051826 RepID=A0ABT8KN08_9BACT|nr:SusD/RagB family nutrient-binding outer membrane lipoprotein [Fulvivirgaceae bacterium BMA10]